jgi:hypothetical protein
MRDTLVLTRDSYDAHDPFGWVQGWRFALCDYITSELGGYVPDFRQGPFGAEVEAWEYETLMDEEPDIESAKYALKVLDRYREWLRVAGKDY